MPNSTFSVLGGDLRQSYLAACLRNLGQEVTVFAVSALPDSAPCRPDPLSPDSGPARTLREALAGARVVVCPVPISKDGIYLAGTAREASPSGNGRPPADSSQKIFFSGNGQASADSSQVPGISLAALLEELTPGQLLVGGALPKAFREACHRKQISTADLLEEEAFLSANAALTAEGLLGVLLSDTPFSLTGRKILLLGYGRCGQETARLLSAFSAKLWVLEREEAALARARAQGHLAFPFPETGAAKNRGPEAEVSTSQKPEAGASTDRNPEAEPPMDFDLVINTIPARVLSPSLLSRLPVHCRIFDIASAPFGFDLETARSLGLSCTRCPGLPGQWSPQTAGEIMGKTILERMLSHGF